jgi:hypothetical protein
MRVSGASSLGTALAGIVLELARRAHLGRRLGGTAGGGKFGLATGKKWQLKQWKHPFTGPP